MRGRLAPRKTTSNKALTGTVGHGMPCARLYTRVEAGDNYGIGSRCVYDTSREEVIF